MGSCQAGCRRKRLRRSLRRTSSRLQRRSRLRELSLQNSTKRGAPCRHQPSDCANCCPDRTWRSCPAATMRSAKLVADAGYKITFMSGFAVSAARLGMPDTGLVSFAEMLDSLRNCCAAASPVPLIGDGDSGYGNALNVQRTVIEYARAGAAGVMIEDQVSPKKCGHTRANR